MRSKKSKNIHNSRNSNKKKRKIRRTKGSLKHKQKGGSVAERVLSWERGTQGRLLSGPAGDDGLPIDFKIIKAPDPGYTCPICLDEYSSRYFGEEASWYKFKNCTKGEHWVHFTCMDGIINSGGTQCPMCRAPHGVTRAEWVDEKTRYQTAFPGDLEAEKTREDNLGLPILFNISAMDKIKEAWFKKGRNSYIGKGLKEFRDKGGKVTDPLKYLPIGYNVPFRGTVRPKNNCEYEIEYLASSIQNRKKLLKEGPDIKMTFEEYINIIKKERDDPNKDWTHFINLDNFKSYSNDNPAPDPEKISARDELKYAIYVLSWTWYPYHKWDSPAWDYLRNSVIYAKFKHKKLKEARESH